MCLWGEDLHVRRWAEDTEAEGWVSTQPDFGICVGRAGVRDKLPPGSRFLSRRKMLLGVAGMVVDYLVEVNKTTVLRYDWPTNQCILCLKLDAFRGKCTSVKSLPWSMQKHIHHCKCFLLLLLLLKIISFKGHLSFR